MNKIAKSILRSNKIVITAHRSPDGDAMGSTLGLYSALKCLNKDVEVVFLEKLPEYLAFLPGYNDIVVTDDYYKDLDLLIVLDCGDSRRINSPLSIDERYYEVINIDHHVSNDMYGDINYVDTKAAAVGEIIFELLDELNAPLTEDVATCLYTSLLTDTGGFRHSNTTKRTHRIIGELIDTGIDFPEIHRNLYEKKPYEKVKLYGKVIDSIELALDGKLCFMEIRDEDKPYEDISISDAINFGMSIDGVEVTAFIKQNGEDGVKVSLRSKKIVNVNEVAKYFGGGGHKRAAGLACEMDFEEMKYELKEIISKELI